MREIQLLKTLTVWKIQTKYQESDLKSASNSFVNTIFIRWCQPKCLKVALFSKNLDYQLYLFYNFGVHECEKTK
jgi:hypothetical protein